MLCPICGAEVGNEIRLCEACDSARAARLAGQSRTDSGGAGHSSSGHGAVESFDAELVSGEPTAADVIAAEVTSFAKRIGRIVAGLGLVAVLILIKALIRGEVRHVVNPPPDTPGVVATGTRPDQPPDPNMPNTGTAIEKRTNGIISVLPSSAQFNTTTVRFASALALYTRGGRRLELAFFRDPISGIDRETLLSRNDLTQVAGLRPDLVATILFKSGAAKCAIDAIERFRLTFYNPVGAWPGLPGEFGMDVIGGDSKAIAKNPLDQFNCDLENGSPLKVLFRGARSVFVKDNVLPVNWDLQLDTLLTVPTPPTTLKYDSADAKSKVALWDAAKRELSIGFYSTKVTPGLRERMRERRSLTAVPEHQPDAVLTLSLGTGSDEVRPEGLKTFGVQLFRARGAQLDFPGTEDVVSAFFVGGAQNVGTFSELTGMLIEGSRVSGMYEHKFRKEIGGTGVDISWLLKWNATVVDLSLPPRTISADAADQDEDDLPPGSILSVSVENNTVQGQSAFGLYYPDTGDVAIGIYAETLTDADRAELRKRGTFSSFVNNKRPLVVLYLDFAPEQTEASYDQLHSYTVYFYRAAGSVFQFGGNLDAVTIKRKGEQISHSEVRELSGSIKPGGKIHLAIAGRASPNGSTMKFAWRIAQDVEIGVR